MEYRYILNRDESNFIFNEKKVKLTDGTFSLQEVDGSFNDTSPVVISKEVFFASELSEVYVEFQGDVTFVLNIDDQDMWWDGTEWTTSDRTADQSNSILEINDNLAALPSFTAFRFIFFLNSMGVEDAILSDARFSYIPVDTESVVKTVKVFLNTRDLTGNITDIDFTIQCSKRGMVEYKSSTILIPGTAINVSTKGGYVEIDLVETDNMAVGAFYRFRIGNITMSKIVPETETRVNILDLPDYVG